MDIMPLGHSWPGLHWWLSLTSGDQGVWVAGIGSLAAAGTALWISGRDARRIRSNQRKRERITASYMYTDIAYLARDAVWTRSELINNSKKDVDQMLAASLIKIKNSLQMMRLVVDRSRFEVISQLPGSTGQSLALGLGGFPSSLDAVSSVIYKIETQAAPWEDIKSELSSCAVGLDPAIHNVLDFLRWFNVEFDFLEKSRPHEFLSELLKVNLTTD